MINQTTNSVQAEAQQARIDALMLEVKLLRTSMANGRHSIINCLCVVKGGLELAIRNMEGPAPLLHSMKAILRATDRSIAAVNDSFPSTFPLNCKAAEKTTSE